MPGKVSAVDPGAVDPKAFDLIGLAMQEPQYRSPGVRELLDAVAKSRVPCMSIMNMPPLPYVKRIPGLDYEALNSTIRYLMFSVFSVRPGELGDDRAAVVDDAATFFKQQEERGVVVRGLADAPPVERDLAPQLLDLGTVGEQE